MKPSLVAFEFSGVVFKFIEGCCFYCSDLVLFHSLIAFFVAIIEPFLCFSSIVSCITEFEDSIIGFY